MKPRVVIGANFGDEGKGLVVDYLCRTQGAGVVVRFNGGAQAGHTVVCGDQRHVCHHVGSGVLCGVPTFLSSFFVCNPLLFLKEVDDLAKIGMDMRRGDYHVYAAPECPVTTFADMIINQRKEDARGAKRHGSCGVGIHETLQRQQVSSLSITMSDLWNSSMRLEQKLHEICSKWATFRTGKPIEKPEAMIGAFLKACDQFAHLVHPAGIGQCEEPIFEGAQGLLLDQDNTDNWPHVTHSKTGMHNVKELCHQAGWAWPNPSDVYYVSRTYLTRHGAGPLPGEDPKMSFEDNTNVDHDYQGSLRFAPLRMDVLDRCDDDLGAQGWNLVLTHCDQLELPADSALRSYGPEAKDIERVSHG